MAEDVETFRRGLSRTGEAAAGAAGTTVEIVQSTRGAGWSSPAAARKLVLVSMLGLLAIAFYRARNPEADVNLYRRLWGVGVLGVMLSIVADFAPQVGGPFALLVLLGSLTNGGDRALQNALGNVGRRLPAGAGPTRRAAPTTRPTAPAPTSTGGR